jgi:hypothetical protein
MTTRTPTRSGDLAVIGLVHGDDAHDVEVRLIVPDAVRTAGRGPIRLQLARNGVELRQAELIWLVSTNKGWFHMRGEAVAAAGGPPLPFRADVYASVIGRDRGPDRLALRLYAPGDDPNQASPVDKVSGWMEPGSIRM